MIVYVIYIPYIHLLYLQYAVFYSGDECLGSACIAEAGDSLWQLKEFRTPIH